MPMMSAIIKMTAKNSHYLSSAYSVPGTVLFGAYLFSTLLSIRDREK